MFSTRYASYLSTAVLTLALSAGCGPAADDQDDQDDVNCVEAEREVGEDTTLEGCVLAPNGLRVTDDALLTVAPGTRIIFGEDAQLIAVEGRLNADGTADDPITFTGDEEIPSYWIGVQFNGTNSTDNVLNHVVIEYAGQNATGYSGSRAAALDLNSWNGPVRVAIDNTTIRHSDEFGIRVDDDVTITSFDGNTISENARAGLATPAGVGQLAGNSSFGGNDDNVVEVSNGHIHSAVTWPNLDGADYLVRDRIKVEGDDTNGALTVEPGTTVAFDQNTGIVAHAGGTLNARGTADMPIVFTGKEKTEGYWRGLHYNSTNSTDNVLEHAIIEYGGGESWGSGYSGSSPANLLLNNWSGAVRLSINDVVIRGSGSVGLHVREAADDIVIDGCSNVTFEDNTGEDISPQEATCP